MISKLRHSLSLAAALALLAGPALAQQQGQWQGQQHNAPQGQWQGPQHNAPQDHPMAPPQHQPYAPQHETYAPQHGSWHQGDHYNGQREVVRDWSHHHLRQPPSGYEWVQSGNQYVLIAITTGVIASIIASAEAQ